MNHRRPWGLLLVALALAAGLSVPALAAPQAQTPTPGAAQTPTASFALLRLVHAAPGAGPVSTFLDDDEAFCSLGFARVTRYEYVGPGTHSIRVAVLAEAPGTPAALATAAPAPMISPQPTASAPVATAPAPAATEAPSPGGRPCCGPPEGVTPQFGRGPGEGPGEGPGPGGGPRGPGGPDSAVNPGAAAQPATPSSQQVVAAASVSLTSGVNYSAVVVGATGSGELLMLMDDLSAPPAGQVKVRFVNGSANAPALDLVESGGPTIASGVAYKGATGYAVLAPASVELQVREAGTSNVLATLPSAGLDGGAVYTVYAVGTMNGQPPLQLRLSVDSVSGMPVPSS